MSGAESAPTMEISVAFARVDDLETLADLLAELFTLESDFQPERDKQLRALRLIVDNPAIGRLFVVRVGSEIAGMANALITISTAEGGRVVLLEDVIVKAAFRGRKLGRQLLSHVLDWAAGEGMPRVTLLADRDNAAALAFYAGLGFAPSAMRVLRKTLPLA